MSITVHLCCICETQKMLDYTLNKAGYKQKVPNCQRLLYVQDHFATASSCCLSFWILNLKLTLNWAVQLYICWEPTGKETWRTSGPQEKKLPIQHDKSFPYSLPTKGNHRLTLVHTSEKPPLCLLIVWMTGPPWSPWDRQTTSTCPMLFRPQRPSPACCQ